MLAEHPAAIVRGSTRTTSSPIGAGLAPHAAVACAKQASPRTPRIRKVSVARHIATFLPANGDRAVLGRYALGSRATALARLAMRSAQVRCVAAPSRRPSRTDRRSSLPVRAARRRCGRFPALRAGRFPAPLASATGMPPISRKWTAAPIAARARSCSRPKLATRTSKVTRPPECVNSAPSKSKPTALRGQLARALDPGELRVAVDEALDQPGAREPVRPTDRCASPTAACGTSRDRRAAPASSRHAARLRNTAPPSLPPGPIGRPRLGLSPGRGRSRFPPACRTSAAGAASGFALAAIPAGAGRRWPRRSFLTSSPYSTLRSKSLRTCSAWASAFRFISTAIAKPPSARMSASISASAAARVEPAGSRYTPSRSTPQPVSLSARQTRIRTVESRAGRLSTSA